MITWIKNLFSKIINKGREQKVIEQIPIKNAALDAVNDINKKRHKIRQDEARERSEIDAAYLNQLLNLFFGMWSPSLEENMVAFKKFDLEWRKYTHQMNEKYSKRLGSIPPNLFAKEVWRNHQLFPEFKEPKLPNDIIM